MGDAGEPSPSRRGAWHRARGNLRLTRLNLLATGRSSGGRPFGFARPHAFVGERRHLRQAFADGDRLEGNPSPIGDEWAGRSRAS